jgi:thioredoxin reductase (NADPH)
MFYVNSMNDLIIIGGGPAGLTAAIYAIRAGLKVLIAEKLSFGGQVLNSYEIENYPGFAEPIAGWERMAAMENQVKRLGVESTFSEALSIEKDEQIFNIKFADGSLKKTKAVIVCTGASHCKLGITGEDNFIGRGVSYCATCDGAFFKDKITSVIGGGNTALEEALFLTKFASKVYLIHRRNEFRASEILQKRIMENDKIVPILNSIPVSIDGANDGSNKVESITVQSKDDNSKRKIETDGVFIFVGINPNSNFMDKSLLNQAGELIVNDKLETSISGLYGAGDVRSNSKRQNITACANGASAAINVYEYISSMKI